MPRGMFEERDPYDPYSDPDSDFFVEPVDEDELTSDSDDADIPPKRTKVRLTDENFFIRLISFWHKLRAKKVNLSDVVQGLVFDKLKIVEKPLKSGSGKEYVIVDKKDSDHIYFAFEVIQKPTASLLVVPFKEYPIPKVEDLTDLLLNKKQKFVIALSEKFEKDSQVNIHKVAKDMHFSLSGETNGQLAKEGVLKKTLQGYKIGPKLFADAKKYQDILKRGKRYLKKTELLKIALGDPANSEKSFHNICLSVFGQEVGSEVKKPLIKDKLIKLVGDRFVITEKAKEIAKKYLRIKEPEQPIYAKVIKKRIRIRRYKKAQGFLK